MKYHYQIGFPSTLALPKHFIYLTYSDHAIQKINSYGIESLPTIISFNKENIVEIETSDNETCDSVVLRIPFGSDKDVSLSLKVFFKSAVFKTVWLNNKNDHHETLDKSCYDIPDNTNSKELDEIYAGSRRKLIDDIIKTTKSF